MFDERQYSSVMGKNFNKKKIFKKMYNMNMGKEKLSTIN